MDKNSIVIFRYFFHCPDIIHCDNRDTLIIEKECRDGKRLERPNPVCEKCGKQMRQEDLQISSYTI